MKTLASSYAEAQHNRSLLFIRSRWQNNCYNFRKRPLSRIM